MSDHYLKIMDREVADRVLQRMLNDGATVKASVAMGGTCHSKSPMTIWTHNDHDRSLSDRLVKEETEQKEKETLFHTRRRERRTRENARILGFIYIIVAGFLGIGVATTIGAVARWLTN